MDVSSAPRYILGVQSLGMTALKLISGGVRVSRPQYVLGTDKTGSIIPRIGHLRHDGRYGRL